MFLKISEKAVINSDEVLKVFRQQLTDNRLTGITYGDWVVILKNGDKHYVEDLKIDELVELLNSNNCS